MRSQKDIEDRVIRMAKTLVGYVNEPNVAYRTNNKLRPKVQKQLTKLVERCSDLRAEEDGALAKRTLEQFAQEIGLYDPEYDDQGYIEISRERLKDYIESIGQSTQQTEQSE